MKELEKKIVANWPTTSWAHTRLLLGVSGGADSVAMLIAFCRLFEVRAELDKDRLHVAHFNHGWRSEESDRDEAFVRDLSSRLGVSFHLGAATNSPASNPSEQKARTERYNFFTQTAYHTGARYVLVAHTADDRVETMLHNLFRGSGLSGLAQPKQFRELHDELVVVRPLLDVFREEVEQYLRDSNQPYIQDSSNEDERFKRNWLRKTMLPQLEEQYGQGLLQRLSQFTNLAEQHQDVLANQVEAYAIQLAAKKQSNALQPDSKNEICVACESLLPANWLVVQHFMKKGIAEKKWPLGGFTFSHWHQLELHWQQQSTEAFNLPGGLLVRCTQRGWLQISNPCPQN